MPIQGGEQVWQADHDARDYQKEEDSSAPAENPPNLIASARPRTADTLTWNHGWRGQGKHRCPICAPAAILAGAATLN
jgi:hypothetical protein